MTTYFFPNQMLPDRGVIAISGDGALSFLHNLLTCDVANLGQGQATYGALLSPQGKILHDLFVFNAGDQILLDCALEQRDALLQKLMMYKLRAKLTITARDDLEVAAGDEGYTDPRNAQMGHRFFAAKGTFMPTSAPSALRTPPPAELGGGRNNLGFEQIATSRSPNLLGELSEGLRGLSLPPAQGGRDIESYDEARITLGLADSTQDIGTNTFFPHEANLDQFGGVNFTKGCYVGQEVVSRMQHRGTARSRILPVTGQGLTKGASITSGDKAIGEILSTTSTNALALIRLDRLADATAPLLSNAVTLKVQKPDWIKYDVPIPEAAR
jgi:tRNA-modifying protein YgfZ